MVTFDPGKPVANTRFNSQEFRDNFQALSRANDLRCSEQDPPDLTIRVEPGTFSAISATAVQFAGGDTDPIDTVMGGASGQERYFVVEMTPVGALFINESGAWASAGSATVPSFTAGNVPLCTVLISYNDTEITNDQIVDVRPVINLGAGEALLQPDFFTTFADETGPLGLGSGNGQATFDVSSAFTYIPDQNELLVWVDGAMQTVDPDPGSAYGDNGDYIEVDSTTIEFNVPVSDGSRVTIWKVGLSAASGAQAFVDLSDINANQSGAFQAADAPTAINPFLTVSGHAAIDHSTLPSLAPFTAHLVTTATNAASRHHASEIEATDNFTFTNATDVQGVLDDVEASIYQQFLDEHNADGTHGPKVTVTQTNDDNALLITHDGNSTAALHIDKASGNANCLEINNTGSGHGISVTSSGDGEGIRIVHDTTSSSDALNVDYNGGTGTAVHIENTSAGANNTCIITQGATTNAFDALEVNQLGLGQAIDINMTNTSNGSDVISLVNSGSGAGVRVTQEGNPGTLGALFVNQNHTGAARGLRIDHEGSDYALYVNKQSTSVTAAVKINNAASSASAVDIDGASSNWRIYRNGNAEFNNVEVGKSGSSGFLIFTPSNRTPTFPCDAVNGRDTSITVTSTWTKIQTKSAFHDVGHTFVDISRIETAGIADGTVVIFTWGDRGSGGNTAEPRFIDNSSADGVCVTGNLAMSTGTYSLGENSDWDNNIIFMKDGSEWIQIPACGLANIS